MTWKDNIPGSPTEDKEFTASYQWQYVGIPVESVLAVGAFYKGFVRQYDEKYNGDGTKFFQKWHDISTYDALTAFTGYELTQKTPETYYISGKLVLGNRTLTLTREAAEITTYTGSDETLKYYGLGQNIFGNSYTASIDIEKMEFPPEVENTVYIYNTGSFAEWGAKHNIPAPTSEVNTPGQYIAIPQSVASTIMYGRIPSMQGFMLKFTNGQTKHDQPPAYITLKYNDLVIRNGKPQRVPSYNGEESTEAVATPAKHSYVRNSEYYRRLRQRPRRLQAGCRPSVVGYTLCRYQRRQIAGKYHSFYCRTGYQLTLQWRRRVPSYTHTLQLATLRRSAAFRPCRE